MCRGRVGFKCHAPGTNGESISAETGSQTHSLLLGLKLADRRNIDFAITSLQQNKDTIFVAPSLF